jgi:hypothetical protein
MVNNEIMDSLLVSFTFAAQNSAITGIGDTVKWPLITDL